MERFVTQSRSFFALERPYYFGSGHAFYLRRKAKESTFQRMPFSLDQFFLGLFALSTTFLIFYFNRKRLNFVLEIWRQIRLIIVVRVFFLLIISIVVIFGLFQADPFFEWGWMNFFSQESGNVFIQPVVVFAHAVEPSIPWGAYVVRGIILLFYCVILCAIPFVTHAEEVIFRHGAIKHKDVVFFSIAFGLIHLVVGIPIAAALALILVGFFYGYTYRSAYFRFVKTMPSHHAQNRATIYTTVHHTVYNSFLVLGLILLEFV